jgi:hypothetical protein
MPNRSPSACNCKNGQGLIRTKTAKASTGHRQQWNRGCPDFFRFKQERSKVLQVIGEACDESQHRAAKSIFGA